MLGVKVQPTVRGENVESATLALETSSAQASGEPAGSPVTTILRVHLQNGPHHTIGDALLEAKIGDKIIVSPGRYREALRINKAIQIIGDGHLSVDLKIGSQNSICNSILSVVNFAIMHARM
jgi:hypothetical protein